jgi:ATP-dependent protease ClpP protease subunit
MNEVVLEVNGMIDHYGWQRTNIRYFLNKNKGNAVRLKVNSFGGSVNEAIAISKLLEDHGNVTVEFIGFCASAVTWMAFGAKTREMHEDSLWLCHKSSIRVDIYRTMNSDQLADTIKQLENEKKNQDAIDLIIAKKYADMCADKDKSLADVFDLMKQERWLSADEVKEWGFIDNIIPGINKITDEYRNLLIENCAALNFPLPAIIDKQDDPLANDEVSESLANRIVNSIKAIFTPMPKSTEDNNPINNSTIMNKTFVMVNALLGVEGLAENNGKVELTIDQLQKICNALKEADDNKQSVTKATEALDAISPNIKGITGLENKIQAVAVVLNMVPKGVPAGNALPKEDKAEDFSETAKDPVNEFVKER